MLNKSLIQFSVDGQGCIPSLLFDLRPNYGGGNEENGDLLQKVLCRHCHSQRPQLCCGPCQQQAAADPCLCQGHLDALGQVWVRLLWGHCSFLLGPGEHKVLFVPSKSLFPQSCASSVINSYWPPKSTFLGVLSPFARSPGWEICCRS